MRGKTPSKKSMYTEYFNKYVDIDLFLCRMSPNEWNNIMTGFRDDDIEDVIKEIAQKMA